jgi:hypothetical protein
MHLAGASAASQAAPGVLGFLVVAGMGVALYFLFRSMTKHLRKVAVDPRQDHVAAGSPAAGGAAAGGPASGGPAVGGPAAGGPAVGSAATGGAAASGVATGDSVSDRLANRGAGDSGTGS